MPRRYYDAVIIGSGQAGTPLAQALADSGWTTALIEQDHVGGTCINTGCTPTKTMIASARVAYLARRAADFGIDCEPVKTDFQEVVERKNEVVESFRHSDRQRIEEAENLDLIRGTAYFVGPKEVEVRLDKQLVRSVEAGTIFINTGTRASVPPIAGIKSVPVLDEADVMDLEALPRHLMILGGGSVGLEFAQMFARLGTRVSLIEMEDQILPGEDKDVADTLLEILRDEGIDIHVATRVKQIGPDPDGDTELQIYSSGDQVETLTGSHFLVAAGRRPNTDMLELEKTGIRTDDEGYIITNAYLETNIPQIYALGDVRGGPAFTHIAYDDFRIIRTNLLEDGHATIDDRLVPYVIYTDPELGRIGLTEQQAHDQGRAVKVGQIPMSSSARAVEMGETDGLMKVVVDADTDQILGCAILGVHGGELMSAIEIAMMGHLPYTALRDGIFAHPTLAETLNTLFLNVDSE